MKSVSHWIMLNVEKYYQDVELFVQTFDLSKSSFPFFGEFEMYNDYFRLKKKKRRGRGKRRKLVFPVPFQSYKKTFVINK